MCQVIWSPLPVLPRLQPQRKVRKLMRSSRKYPYPPSTQGTFILYPHPIRISIPGAACHTPVPRRISLIFHLGSPWEEYFCQKAVALYYYAECNCWDKVRKNCQFCPVEFFLVCYVGLKNSQWCKPVKSRVPCIWLQKVRLSCLFRAKVMHQAPPCAARAKP